MKRFIKITALILLICLTVPFALPVNSVSLQEKSWLSHLRPASLPKPGGSTSYPAELVVSMAGHEDVHIKGACSLEGQLTDEDILDAIKKAASQSGYKSPENAVADKLTVAELKDKLSFSEKEKERIIKNWLSLVGMDKVADMLKGELPTYGETDAVTTVVGMISSGKLPQAKDFLPFPTSMSGIAQGLVVNGVYMTVDQYKRDQQKYQDIVELSNARARYREFQAHLNTIIKDKTKKNTAWVVRIQDQVVKDQLYRSAPEIYVPYIYSTDIVLTKKDENYENPVGLYEGEFKIDVDLSLEDYDKNFHKYLAEYLNNELKKNSPVVLPAMLYSPVSQSVNRTSENKTTLGNTSVYVNLTGALGGVYEMDLDTYALDILYQKVIHDQVSVIQKKTDGGTETLTWTEITDSETKTAYRQDHNHIVLKSGEELDTVNTDDDPYPDVDVRSYISLKLTVDMSGY